MFDSNTELDNNGTRKRKVVLIRYLHVHFSTELSGVDNVLVRVKGEASCSANMILFECACGYFRKTWRTKSVWGFSSSRRACYRGKFENQPVLFFLE